MQVPKMQTLSVPVQELPAQQGCMGPPQPPEVLLPFSQTPAVLQTASPLQPAAQQAWPTAPQPPGGGWCGRHAARGVRSLAGTSFGNQHAAIGAGAAAATEGNADRAVPGPAQNRSAGALASNLCGRATCWGYRSAAGFGVDAGLAISEKRAAVGAHTSTSRQGGATAAIPIPPLQIHETTLGFGALRAHVHGGASRRWWRHHGWGHCGVRRRWRGTGVCGRRRRRWWWRHGGIPTHHRRCRGWGRRHWTRWSSIIGEHGRLLTGAGDEQCWKDPHETAVREHAHSDRKGRSSWIPL